MIGRYTRRVVPGRLAALALPVVAALGCDDSIDLRLVAPAGESARPVDYGCVDRIEVLAFGTVDDREACAPIVAGTIDTLRDHNLGGLIDLEIPPGLFAVDLRGVRATGDGCDGDTVFHAEGYYTDGWTIDLPLAHALDCRDLTTDTTPAQLLDLAKVLGNGADRCAPPANAAGYPVLLQHQYPYDLGDGDLTAAADRALTAGPVSAAGVTAITGSHFTGAVDASCMTLGSTQAPAGALPATTCIDLTAPTLCASAGTAELMVMSPAMFAQFAAVQEIGAAVSVGLVWDRTTRRPLANATVTPVAGSAAFGFRYFDFAAGTVTPSVATATTASGLFAVEIGAPTLLEIRVPGRATRRVAVAAGSDTIPGIQSIPM